MAIEVEPDFDRPNWTPLNGLIADRCGEYMWMCRAGEFEVYKHKHSRREIVLDRAGRCFTWGRVSAEIAGNGSVYLIVGKWGLCEFKPADFAEFDRRASKRLN